MVSNTSLPIIYENMPILAHFVNKQHGKKNCKNKDKKATGILQKNYITNYCQRNRRFSHQSYPSLLWLAEWQEVCRLWHYQEPQARHVSHGAMVL